MEILSKHTEKIKDIVTEYLLDDLADIVLQYTGSFVQVSKHCPTQSSIEEEYYFLTANVLSACVYNYKQKYYLYFAIKNNIGWNEKKELIKPYAFINRLNPTKKYTFYKYIYSNYNYGLRLYQGNIKLSNIKKCLQTVNIFIKKENGYANYECSFGMSQNYSKILNKKEYEQFISDFRGICAVIFDITKKN
jgi:hypothetical protein